MTYSCLMPKEAISGMRTGHKRRFSEFSKPQHMGFALSTSWRVLLGFIALFDIFAATRVFREASEVCSSTSHRAKETCSSPAENEWLLRSMMSQFLDKWRLHIGVVFAFLCFVDAVLKARWTRDKIMVEETRQRLLGRTDERQERVLRLAWHAYMLTIGLHLLAFPMGIFVFVRQILARGYTESTRTEENTYSMDPGQSVAMAVFHYYLHATYQAIGEQLVVWRKVIVPQIVRFIIYHPLQFSSYVRTALRTLRLVKYLGPVFGNCAKFSENAFDLLKLLRQHLQAARSRRIRKKGWEAMTPAHQLVAATVRVQSTVRGIQTRKSVRGYVTILRARQAAVARRIQKVLRSSVVRAASRIDLKKLELETLEEEARGARIVGSGMSTGDRRRMYQLQDEVRETAYDLVQKRLLLRPNTRFAVIWKVGFLLFVILDICQRIWATETAQIGVLVQNQLLPTTEWQECTAIDSQTKTSFLTSSIGALNQLFRRQRVVPSEFRWYCGEPFVSLQSYSVIVLQYLWARRSWIVGMIFYVDVVVTFFIGTLHPKTGALVPKPFFMRWLFPGLIWELLANPEMENTSRFLRRILANILVLGPFRVWRWTLVFFYPLFKVAIRSLTVKVCVPAIEKENQMQQLQEMDRATAVRPAWRPQSVIRQVQSRTALGAARRRSVLSNGDVLDVQSRYLKASFQPLVTLEQVSF